MIQKQASKNAEFQENKALFFQFWFWFEPLLSIYTPWICSDVFRGYRKEISAWKGSVSQLTKVINLGGILYHRIGQKPQMNFPRTICSNKGCNTVLDAEGLHNFEDDDFMPLRKIANFTQFSGMEILRKCTVLGIYKIFIPGN